jgi:hypothetical protein
LLISINNQFTGDTVFIYRAEGATTRKLSGNKDRARINLEKRLVSTEGVKTLR